MLKYYFPIQKSDKGQKQVVQTSIRKLKKKKLISIIRVLKLTIIKYNLIPIEISNFPYQYNVYVVNDYTFFFFWTEYIEIHTLKHF